MNETLCEHRWFKSNVRRGYLVIEGCFQCKGRIASFSDAPVPPVEDHREGEHFWSQLGGFPAVKFDLKCAKCSTEILLGDVMAVMRCMTCNPECGVFEVAMGDVDLNSRVCVALCADITHGVKQCVSDEGLRALNDYFDHEFTTSGRRILVVPCSMRRSADTCQAVALADAGLAELH
jgi:hypothetical protein